MVDKTDCRGLQGVACVDVRSDPDQIRSEYISSSHTRLIRCSTIRRVHLMHDVRIFGDLDQVHSLALAQAKTLPLNDHSDVLSDANLVTDVSLRKEAIAPVPLDVGTLSDRHQVVLEATTNPDDRASRR